MRTERPIEYKKRGRKKKLDRATREEMVRLYQEPEATSHEIAARFGICVATLHKYVAAYRKEHSGGAA